MHVPKVIDRAGKVWYKQAETGQNAVDADSNPVKRRP
jgi:hypothetical protein